MSTWGFLGVDLCELQLYGLCDLSQLRLIIKSLEVVYSEVSVFKLLINNVQKNC